MRSKATSSFALDATRLPAGLASQRVTDMVIVRESAMYDRQLLAGMQRQTLSYCGHLPGVNEVLAEELGPLVSATCHFPHFRVNRRHNRAVVFEHSGVIYLYSEGSAASLDELTGDNDFVMLVAELFKLFRPINVHVATLGRLVRAAQFSGTLLGVAEYTVDEVRIGGSQVIKLRDPYGKMHWQTLGMISAFERDLIIQRLLVGRINQFLRGEWVLGRNTEPPGYPVVDGRLVRDDSTKDHIEKVLTILADPDAGPRAVVEKLARLGVVAHRRRGKNDARVPVDQLSCATTYVQTLLRWHGLWSTGKYEVVHRNPFPGMEDIGGLPVDYSVDRDRGHLRFVYNVGLPPGGVGVGRCPRRPRREGAPLRDPRRGNVRGR